MGYLNKSTVTVDAILTKKGRELLARGKSAFVITKFAVADDEIDYGLYDPAHPLGSEYYGSAIESMPIVEASPDETQNLRYKLVTLRRGTNTIPTIFDQGGRTSIVLTYSSQTANSSDPIVPKTSQNFDGADFGYTAILYDRSAATLRGSGLTTSPTTTGIAAEVLAASTTAQVQIGTQFTIIPNDVSKIINTQLVIIGNESGATVTIPVTIKPASQISSS